MIMQVSLKRNFFFSSSHLFSVALFTLFMFTSCASAFTGMAVSSRPLDGVPFESLGTKEITLTWYTFDIGILGFGTGEDKMDEALRQIQDELKSDALVNIRWWSDRSVFVFITRNRLNVKAEGIRMKPAEPLPPPVEKGKPRR